ncbi:MAG TPA: hypothetical protein VIY51_15380 [Xanthobacteraceae bacterium]
MRGMIKRTFLAGVALAVAAMLVPFAASARMNGFVAGGQALVRPGQAPPVPVSAGLATANHLSGWERLRHHRRVFGFGLPVAGIGAYYGPIVEPQFDAGFVARPVPAPAAGDRVSGDHGGCRTETRTVPSEAGGTRTVRITLCWQG